MNNTLVFLYIDSVCAVIVILYFIEVLNRTRLVSRKMVNLELNKMCFLIMMSNAFLNYVKISPIQKAALYIVLAVIFTLVSLNTFTGYVALILVVPFVLLRMRYA